MNNFICFFAYILLRLLCVYVCLIFMQCKCINFYIALSLDVLVIIRYVNSEITLLFYRSVDQKFWKLLVTNRGVYVKPKSLHFPFQKNCSTVTVFVSLQTKRASTGTRKSGTRDSCKFPPHPILFNQSV
jgi:hypothetical protein